MSPNASLGAGLGHRSHGATRPVHPSRQVLAELAPGRTGVVVVGRPYNTCDLGVCQDLPRKLRKLGVVPIPLDFLGARHTMELGALYLDTGRQLP